MTRLLNLRVFGAGIVLSTALLAAASPKGSTRESNTTTPPVRTAARPSATMRY